MEIERLLEEFHQVTEDTEINGIYRLYANKLPEILKKILPQASDIILRKNGLGIFGVYQIHRDHYSHRSVGILVKQSAYR